MKKVHHNKAGFVLVSILSVIMVLSLAFGTFMFSGQQQTFTTTRMINRTKALAYAEAGIDYSFAKLSADFKQRHNLGAFGINGGSINSDGAMESIYAEGSFAITLATNGNRYCVVTSVGKCRGQEVTAEILAEDYNADTGGSTPPVDYKGMDGFKYAILSGNTLKVNGDVTISGSNNKIHTNTYTDYKNKVAGENVNTVTATKGLGNKIPAGGKIAPEVPFPQIDTTLWENEAAKNLMVFEKLSDAPASIKGGILVITGSNSYTINDAINATVIFKNASQVEVKGDYHPGTKYQLGIVVLEGSVKMAGNGGIYGGITYIKNPTQSFTIQGTPEIHGQILCAGTTTMGGTPNAFLFNVSVPTPPGTDGTTTPYAQDVHIGAWQK